VQVLWSQQTSAEAVCAAHDRGRLPLAASLCVASVKGLRCMQPLSGRRRPLFGPRFVSSCRAHAPMRAARRKSASLRCRCGLFNQRASRLRICNAKVADPWCSRPARRMGSGVVAVSDSSVRQRQVAAVQRAPESLQLRTAEHMSSVCQVQPTQSARGSRCRPCCGVPCGGVPAEGRSPAIRAGQAR
jgi:hypothetical protein